MQIVFFVTALVAITAGMVWVGKSGQRSRPKGATS
jgi:hypothetical protein